jgi:hypothetical protein
MWEAELELEVDAGRKWQTQVDKGRRRLLSFRELHFVEDLYKVLTIVLKCDTCRNNLIYDNASVIPPDPGRQPSSERLLSSEEPFSPRVRVPVQQGLAEEADLSNWKTRDNKITSFLLTTREDSTSKCSIYFFDY